MDLTKILSELRRERELIDQAIAALERVLAGGKRRRGRPPAWLKALDSLTEPARRKPAR